MKKLWARKEIRYIFFALVIGFIVLWLGGFFTPKIKSKRITLVVKKVSGLKIEKVELVNNLETPYMGLVIPNLRAELTSRVFGRVLKVNVKEGQNVSTGQLLIIMDSEDIRAQINSLGAEWKAAEALLKSAEAQYEAQAKTFSRYEALLKEKAVTPQEYDEVKARYESAKEQVKAAQDKLKSIAYLRKALHAQLSYTDLRAPFAGVVVEKKVDVGDIVSPGQVLLILEKGPHKIEAELPVKYLKELPLGQEVKIELGSEPNKRISKGKVVERSEAVDPQSQTFRVKIALLNNEKITSGEVVKILLPERGNFILIPTKSIYKRNDFTGVFVVNPEGKIELRFVKLGLFRGDKVEVLSGLNASDRIVVEGLEKACDGCVIE